MKDSNDNTGKTGKETSTTVPTDFCERVVDLLQTARRTAYRAVNTTMVDAYWNVGRMIIEEEQQGQQRAGYGAELIKNLAERLTREFGKGFTKTNLWYFRQFYLLFPADGSSGIRHALRGELTSGIPRALRGELTWTHYRLLLRVEKPEARMWYMQQAAIHNWSSRALERQINTFYYERLWVSQDTAPVAEEMREKVAALAPTPKDFIRDPYILEFLDIPDPHQFREAELEAAIIGKLQHFMLELGQGFAFVGRQYRVSTETKDFYIDLVFYNYILKCFVLVDLKTGELTHQDIGQMDMYVRLFEYNVKRLDDNPTVGLILCAEKDRTVVKYSVLDENQQMFVARYRLYLPSEEELQAEINRERDNSVGEVTGLYEWCGRAGRAEGRPIWQAESHKYHFAGAGKVIDD